MATWGTALQEVSEKEWGPQLPHSWNETQAQS